METNYFTYWIGSVSYQLNFNKGNNYGNKNDDNVSEHNTKVDVCVFIVFVYKRISSTF